MFNRIGRAFQTALDPDKVGIVKGRQPTPETLEPGDILSTFDYGDLVVEAVLECHEDLNGRVTRWRWTLLDEGRMLETAPDANVLYTRTDVLNQESAGFETLTCAPEHGGVLRSFEERVRQGIAARNPVLFEYGGHTYRLISTGTFGARPVGPEPRQPVWRDVHPTDASQNVYFELQQTDADEEQEDSVVLGVWTTHIALLFGRHLSGADISTIYPRADEPEGTKR